MTKHIKHVSRRDLLRAIDAQAERITALEELANGYLLLLRVIAEEVEGPIILAHDHIMNADTARVLHIRRNATEDVCILLEPSAPKVPVCTLDELLSLPDAVTEEPTDAPHDAGSGIADDPPFTVARDPGDEHRDEPIVYVGGDGSRVRPLL